jgi:biotin--protein ligase
LTHGCIRTYSVLYQRIESLPDLTFFHPLHSDQLVTLTTVDPPIPVRIVGITHDHGLLRTIPERTGWSTSARHGLQDGYIDLQPDGNSFDIMMGLIKAKKSHS